MTVAVRDALPSDRQILLEIESECFGESAWQADDFLRNRTVVAEAGGQIVAFIVVRKVFSGNAAELPEFEILNVASKSAFRRRGIASILLRHVLGEPAVYFLEVRESNQAARNLYCSLGFVPVSRRGEYYENPREDAIVMQMKKC